MRGVRRPPPLTCGGRFEKVGPHGDARSRAGLGSGHRTAERLVRSAFARFVALPGPGGALRPARLRGGLQADHPRAFVASHPALADDPDVHARFRPDRRLADRRRAAVRVLHGGHDGLELLRQLPDAHVQHLHRQRRHFRKGLFSPDGGAGLHRDVAADRLRDPVRIFPVFLCLFLAARRGHPAQLGHRAAAGAVGADGGAGPGLRHRHFVPDDEVPRLAGAGGLRRAAVDVRDAGDLSAVDHAEPVPLAAGGQSHDRRRRDVPLRVFRHGHVLLGVSGLFRGLHGAVAAGRHGRLQPRGTHVHGYGVARREDNRLETVDRRL